MQPRQLVLVLLISGCASLVTAGTKGDEADIIIQNIMANYKMDAHPNSNRPDGAVTVQVAVNPLAINIVSKT